MMKKKNPKIFILSGPGGVGKTTLVEELFKKEAIQKKFMKGISVTTREIRPKEEDGVDYFFIPEDEFVRLKKKKFFLESEKVLEHYYGTPKLYYKMAKGKGKDLILCIDVKGGLWLKKHFKTGKITTIFIDAPSKKDLHKRMKKRAESKELIKRRVELADKELKSLKNYDHVVVNKSIKNSLKELEKILLD
jgi:guanylate kinase